MTQPSPAALRQAAAAFGIDAARLAFVRDSVNVIYEFARQNQSYMLRLSPGALRNRGLILGEMEWMAYLAAHGGRVSQPVRSSRGALVETVEDSGEAFHVAVFHKAPGVHPEGDLLDAAILHQIGQALGQMHRLGRDFRLASPQVRRLHWHELQVFDLLTYVPTGETLVRSECEKILETLRALPVDVDGYGLIHADPEPWNILLHEGTLTFIDFDEACYCWYAFDLAVALLYAVLAAEPADAHSFAHSAWRSLYAGYAAEHPLAPVWLERMPLFLRLRMMEDYAFHASQSQGVDLEERERGWLSYLRRPIITSEFVLGMRPEDFVTS